MIIVTKGVDRENVIEKIAVWEGEDVVFRFTCPECGEKQSSLEQTIDSELIDHLLDEEDSYILRDSSCAACGNHNYSEFELGHVSTVTIL